MLRVYLDSCIVIYLVQAPPEIREAVRGALRPPDGAAPQAYVSALARLECRVFWTNDRRLPASIEQKIRIRVLP